MADDEEDVLRIVVVVFGKTRMEIEYNFTKGIKIDNDHPFVVGVHCYLDGRTFALEV
jgi:hypothetical protein